MNTFPGQFKHTKKQHMKRILAVGVILAAFIAAGAYSSQAQTPFRGKKTNTTLKKSKKRVKRPAKIDGYVLLSSYYDDNVFSYSDSDRTIFENRATPLERFPIDQIDDVVTSVSARGDFVWDRKRRSSWRLRLRYDASLYQNNTFRNNNQFGIELRRKNRRSYTEFSALWTPNYYLRHLFWSRTTASVSRPITGPRYVAADLSKVGFYLEHERRLARRLYGRVRVGYTYRNYGAPFDERDNSTLSVAARLRKRLSRRFEMYVGASLASVSSSASDFNVVGIADIGNTVYGVRGGFEFKLDKRGRLSWTESLSYAHQSYNSSDIVDKFHFNRSDNEIALKTRLTWRVHPHWQPRAYYTLRNSTSNVTTGVNDVGAYSSNRFGVQIIHYF